MALNILFVKEVILILKKSIQNLELGNQFKLPI